MNWIENAEEKQRIKETLIEKYNNVEGDNLDRNDKLITTLFDKTKKLLDRIDQISIEYRKPSLEIGYTEFKQDYQCEFYGSAITTKKNKLLFIDLGDDTYNCWRRIKFKLSDQYDKVKVVISEKCSHDSDKNKSYGIREKYKFSITSLKEEVSENIVNWLVYKISNDEFKSNLPIGRKRTRK